MSEVRTGSHVSCFRTQGTATAAEWKSVVLACCLQLFSCHTAAFLVHVWAVCMVFERRMTQNMWDSPLAKTEEPVTTNSDVPSLQLSYLKGSTPI